MQTCQVMLHMSRMNGLLAKLARRHRDVRVLERYDDNRRDLGGEVAKQVAASVPSESQAP